MASKETIGLWGGAIAAASGLLYGALYDPYGFIIAAIAYVILRFGIWLWDYGDGRWWIT